MNSTAVRNEWSQLADSFCLSLRASRRAPRTLECYRAAVGLLSHFLRGKALAEVSRADIRRFVGDQASRWRPATAHNRYRALRRFFGWLEAEGEIDRDPTRGLSPPSIPETVVSPFRETEFIRLVKACKRDKTLAGARDEAILWVLLDTGIRRSELVGLRRDDVDLRDETVYVRKGKGGRERLVRLGGRAQIALDRYLRRRRDGSPWLWLGRTGTALQVSGVEALLKRRGREAGVSDVRAHRFRHTSAIMFLDAGGRTADLEILMGWRPGSPMLRRYTAANESARAREAHRSLSPADALPWSGRI